MTQAISHKKILLLNNNTIDLAIPVNHVGDLGHIELVELPEGGEDEHGLLVVRHLAVKDLD